jgi:hypothetical protein
MNTEEFLAELETIDVGVVKERIATKVYLRPWSDIAQGWVERRDRQQGRKNCLSLVKRTQLRNGQTVLRPVACSGPKARWLNGRRPTVP